MNASYGSDPDRWEGVGTGNVVWSFSTYRGYTAIVTVSSFNTASTGFDADLVLSPIWDIPL